MPIIELSPHVVAPATDAALASAYWVASVHAPAPAPAAVPPRARAQLRLLPACMAWLALALCAGPAPADETVWEALKRGGPGVVIRHALTTPGVGDPPGFQLGQCATQRNLSDEGRQDAKRLGLSFRTRGVPIARVLSSPWCRCIETAKIAFGEAASHASLGNLFDHPGNRESQLAAFRQLITAPPRGGNLVLVTHGSTISAYTGVSPAMGEMVVITPNGQGQHTLVGRIALAP